jgi:hypothetical protein
MLLEIVICERTEYFPVELNKFMKFKTQDISYFFKFHPYQQKDPFSLFSSNKIIFRENRQIAFGCHSISHLKSLLLSLIGVCFRTKYIY